MATLPRSPVTMRTMLEWPSASDETRGAMKSTIETSPSAVSKIVSSTMVWGLYRRRQFFSFFAGVICQ